MAEVLHSLVGMVVLSGYACELYDRLFTKRGWILDTKQVYAEGQKSAIEALWMNPAAQAALKHRQLEMV